MEAKNIITRLFSSCAEHIIFWQKQLSEAHKEVLLRGSAAEPVAQHDEWINVLEWDRNVA